MHSMQTMIAFESTTPASPRKWPNMTAAAPMMHSSGPAEVSRIFVKSALGFKIITPRIIVSAVNCYYKNIETAF